MIGVGLYDKNSGDVENSTKKSIVEECISESEEREPFKEKKPSWTDVVKKGKKVDLIVKRDHSISNDPSGLI